MQELEELYRRHAPAVLRFAWGLCGDRSLAEDIVSETFVRILTRAPRIETQTALAYLLVIARNVYLTGQRRRRRELPLPEELAAPEHDPARAIDARARLERVLEVLQGFPEADRTALLMRMDHGLAYEEIASALGTTVGAARVRVHRARLRLTQALESKEKTR